MITLAAAARKITELEDQRRPPAAGGQRLLTWCALVRWCAWSSRFEEPLQALAALAHDDPIRADAAGLLWAFRHFANEIPEAARRPGWPEKAKICLTVYIESALDDGLAPAELSQADYMNWAVEWTVEQLLEWPEEPQDTPPPPFEPFTWPEESEPVGPSTMEEPETTTFTTFGNDSKNSKTTTFDEPPPPPADAGPGSVKIKYIGGQVGFELATVEGKKKVTRGVTYHVSPETWENIREFQPKQWEVQ